MEDFFGKEAPLSPSEAQLVLEKWSLNSSTASKKIKSKRISHDNKSYKESVKSFFIEPYPSKYFNYAPLSQYFTQSKLRANPINRYSNISPEEYQACRQPSYKPPYNPKPPYARDTTNLDNLRMENDELARLLAKHEAKKASVLTAKRSEVSPGRKRVKYCDVC